MKRIPMVRLRAVFGTLTGVAALLFLAACASAPGTAPATPGALASPQALAATPTPETTATLPDRPTSTPTPTASLAVPALGDATPAATSLAVSPLPSPIPASDEPSPTAAKVASGELAPDFTLGDVQGESVTLSDYQGGNSVSAVEASNVVLVFYRGKT